MEQIDLSGQRAIIIGIANENSLSVAVARRLSSAGARIALTYHNERTLLFVEPFAKEIGAELMYPCSVPDPEEVSKVCADLKAHWGGVDLVFHAIGAVPKKDLQGRLIECSPQGFMDAMQVSCYSFIQIARATASLMNNGGSLLTLTFYGAERVVDHYNVMGPVKAALFLLSDYASGVTGEILHVDSGHHIESMVFEDEFEAGH